MNEQQQTYEEKIRKMADELKPVGAYRTDFINTVTESKTRISTGFRDLDIALKGGLVNELYILGAETSTGKSAISMAIAQNIAAQGANVLYFALEMSRTELIARGISAISYEHNSQTALTAGDILYHKYDRIAQDFTCVPHRFYEGYEDEYNQRYGEHLFIIENSDGGTTARDLANIATLFKRSHPETPTVVFVDYLQILQADQSDRSQVDRKTKTDVSVTTLKTLASKIGMPVFVLSSVNRNSYGKGVKNQSYNESGLIEFTGGILIGWNWAGVTDTKSADDIEEEKEKCKKLGRRRMVMEIMKFRNAERDAKIWFDYYPAYNYFRSAREKEEPERVTC